MATSRATPIAIPVWRIMLIAPEPVANDEGGSDDVLTPIKVGSANPTPRPIGSMPKVAARKLGSRPRATNHPRNMPVAAQAAMMPGMPPRVGYLDDRENEGRHAGGHH